MKVGARKVRWPKGWRDWNADTAPTPTPAPLLPGLFLMQEPPMIQACTGSPVSWDLGLSMRFTVDKLKEFAAPSVHEEIESVYVRFMDDWATVPRSTLPSCEWVAIYKQATAPPGSTAQD